MELGKSFAFILSLAEFTCRCGKEYLFAPGTGIVTPGGGHWRALYTYGQRQSAGSGRHWAPAGTTRH